MALFARGSVFSPISTFQLPSRVANCKVVGCASGVGLLPAALNLSFWIRELGPVQLQLKLVRLVCKLSLVCQERACDRQNCFRQVVADRYNNKINKISRYLVGNDQMIPSTITVIIITFTKKGKEQKGANSNMYGLIKR